MKVKLVLVISLLVLCLAAFSQPTFMVSQTRGCVPFTLTITGNANGCINLEYKLTTLSGSSLLTGTNQVVTYSKAGKDTIKLDASCGGTGTDSPTIVFIEALDATKPDFTVRNCTNRTVTLTINESKYDYYFIDWNDGSSLQTVNGNNTVQHPYSNTAQRTITVSGIFSYSVVGLGMQQCGNFSTQTIKPIANLTKAAIELLQINTLSDTGNATLVFNISSDSQYKFFQKTGYNGVYGSYSDTLVNQSGQQTLLLKNLNTVQNNYCFKLTAYDYCPATPDIDSDEICTIKASVTGTMQGNNVQWDLYPVLANYNVSVNGVGIVSSIPYFTTTYLDTDVQCRQNYCYRVEADFATFPPIRSISAPVCTTGIKTSNFIPVSNLHATYDNSNQVNLFWNVSTISGIKYNVYTLSSATSTDTIFSDSTKSSVVKPTKKAKCYAVRIADQCGSSPLAKACPISLSGQADSEVQNSLKWPDGYTNGDAIPVTDYTIELYTDANVPISTASLGTSMQYIQNPIDTVNQKVIYKVKAVVGDTVVYSNSFAIIQTLRLYMPNAFTPNGDGLNDNFLAYGLFFETFEMKIYNRWGQLVFSSDNKASGWDGGSFNPDVYHYYVKVTDKFGHDLVNKGTLYLMRQ